MVAAQSAPLKRIRDLLRLAQSSNEHEARLAQRRADDLMRRHGLSERDLTEEAVESASLPAGKDGNQRAELARVVAGSRDCTTRTNRSIEFHGYPEAAKDARELFCALTRIVEENCELPQGLEYAIGRLVDDDRFLWRTCFWLGFVEAVQKQLDPEHASVPKEALATILKSAQAPPVIERAARAFENLRDRFDSVGPDHGHAAAENFRENAHTQGLALGSQIRIPPYRRPR